MSEQQSPSQREKTRLREAELEALKAERRVLDEKIKAAERKVREARRAGQFI